LIAQGRRETELDLDGSLINADLAAYYTWLELQRLPVSWLGSTEETKHL
jgi:hypothetical protein